MKRSIIPKKNKNLKPLPEYRMTQQGLNKLKKELEELASSRQGAVNTLSDARNLGDLSENGLYTAAKARLRSIDSRILRLKHEIKFAKVEDVKKGIVGIGSKVLVEVNGNKKEFIIVGDFEADPLNGKISIYSPVGSMLVGKKVGEMVSSGVPDSKVSYKILRIV